MDMHAWEERAGRISGHLLRLVLAVTALMIFLKLDIIIAILKTPSF